jgi:hypothetical protein
VTIVDTGVPPPGGAIFPIGPTQWVAGQFTLADAHTINTIEGYIQPFLFLGNAFTVAVYAEEGADVPGTELFSGSATYTSALEEDWAGLSGLSWFLPAGTYWASFEIRPSQTFAGSMRTSAPSHLANGAFFFPPVWFPEDNLTIGVRITADAGPEPAPVPEPSTIGLLAVGLAAIRARHRRRTGKTAAE